VEVGKELEEILNNDPLDLLKVGATASLITPDDRLIASFKEINDFFEAKGREPEKIREVTERTLFSRLEQLRKDPEKLLMLKEYDEHDLLGVPKEINTVEDILESDILDILEDDSEGIFELRHVPEKRDKPDFVARREPCEDFSNYEHLFKKVHEDLANGDRKLLDFKDQDLREGGYFVLNGILLFLESIDFQKRVLKDKSQGTRTRLDGRIRCIFENGLESNMFLRSLQKQLYKDGASITESNEETLTTFDKNFGGVSQKEDSVGNIYILSSLSNKPEIQNIKNLYKIGYCTTSVEDRIKGAEKDPTFLMAPVKIVSTYACYYGKPQKFENLVHTVFRKRCLDVEIVDNNGQKKQPKEWYVAPIRVIQRAIELIDNGEIVNYRYDVDLEDLVERDFN